MLGTTVTTTPPGRVESRQGTDDPAGWQEMLNHAKTHHRIKKPRLVPARARTNRNNERAHRRQSASRTRRASTSARRVVDARDTPAAGALGENRAARQTRHSQLPLPPERPEMFNMRYDGSHECGAKPAGPERLERSRSGVECASVSHMSSQIDTGSCPWAPCLHSLPFPLVPNPWAHLERASRDANSDCERWNRSIDDRVGTHYRPLADRHPVERTRTPAESQTSSPMSIPR